LAGKIEAVPAEQLEEEFEAEHCLRFFRRPPILPTRKMRERSVKRY
jgi:hypothetical protein